MTNKQIILTTLGITVVMLGLIGGYVAWGSTQTDTSARSQVDSSDPAANSDDLAVPSGDAGSLSLSSSDLGQLAGGITASDLSTDNSANADKSTQSFSQYDTYKDSPSALYADIEKGTGKAIESGSKVAIYYKGWLTDGTMFDQSRKGEDGNLQPFMFTFGANEVIPGMEQAIFGMKTGGTRRLIIPPSVGYGEQGQKDIIPPNSVLVFDVQLIAVQ